jgi:conjugal transfer pilus assembly protein TraF
MNASLLARFAVAAAALLGAAAPAICQEAEPSDPSHFYERKAEGWFWYKDPKDLPKPKKVVPKAPDPAKDAPKTEPKDAKVEPFSTRWLKDNMPRLLESAVDNPTKENVEAYLYAQRVALDKSQLYAEKARQVVNSDPLLDENNRVPLSTYAKATFLNGIEKGRSAALDHLSKVGGIWVFFDSKCSYCKAQMYSVQQLAKNYGFFVKYISIDGSGMPGLETFVKDNGHAKLLQLRLTPTTVFVVPPSGYFVVSQGLMAEEQLGDRIVFAADSQNLLPPEIAKAVRTYDRGVLTTDDTKTGASDDPKEWVRYLKERLQGRY